MTGFRNFHDGEVEIQTRAGVDTEVFDQMVDDAFRPELRGSEARFIESRTFSVAATIDARRRPWATPLVGRAGQLFHVVDDVTIVIRPQSGDGDPLFDDIAATGELGVLFFDPSHRRRSKSTGRGTLNDDATITYVMGRHFGLCTKYIFVRDHEPDAASDAHPTVAGRRAAVLDDDDRGQLAAADTIFLASFHPAHGADPTHRGGPVGFVEVVDETTLSIPDYTGNGMFQTLGNLLVDDRIGLTAVDFATGRTVQLTGHGAVVEAPGDLGSVRSVRLSIDEVRTSWRDIGVWTDREPFAFRAGLRNPATPYR